MNNLHIVTDSAVDMPAGWCEEYNINILPVNMQINGKSYLPGVTLDAETFYRLVNETNCIPKTSLPSPGQVSAFYEKIAKVGDDILSIHVASKMSGTFQSVQLAVKEMKDKFSIFPFDSGNGSAGLAYMCKEARLMERTGKSMQSIINRLTYIRDRIFIVMTLDSLTFARKSGRVSAIQERLSSILNIKPVIILKDGMLQIADKVRSRKKAINNIIEQVKTRVGDQKVNLAVVHSQDIETAKEMLQKVKTKFNINEIVMTDLSISVAANLGPKTVGIIAYPVADETR